MKEKKKVGRKGKEEKKERGEEINDKGRQGKLKILHIKKSEIEVALPQKLLLHFLHSIYAYINCYIVRARQKCSMGFGSFMLLVLDRYMGSDGSYTLN